MEPRRHSVFGDYEYLGNISVPSLGIILLVIVGLRFSRSAAGLLEWLEVGTITLGTAVIGLAYYKLRRALNQLDGKIDDGVLSGLCLATNLIVCLGYLICVVALTSLHRR